MPNVNVTYEEMRQAATRLATGQSDIEGKLSELHKLVQSLVNGGYVTDTSSKQFEHAYNDFNDGATRVVHSLTDMTAYLKKAAHTFEQADASLASALQNK